MSKVSEKSADTFWLKFALFLRSTQSESLTERLRSDGTTDAFAMKRLISSRLPGAADVLHHSRREASWDSGSRRWGGVLGAKNRGAINAEQTQCPVDTEALTRSELDARRAVGFPRRLHHLGGAAAVSGADILAVEPIAGRRTARGWPGV